MIRGTRRQRNHLNKMHLLVRIGMALCAIAIVVFAVLLIQNNRAYSEGDAVYEDLRPEASATIPVRIDFDLLAEINEDVVGWIRSDGGLIDYPVVRGTDNDYYLTHLFNGQRNKVGAIFMDFRNSGDFSDPSTVIYGHNMKNGSMFSSLTEYKKQSYYDSFPQMTLYTPGGDFTIELFAGIVADGNDEFMRFEFRDDKDFINYITELKNASTFTSETTVSPGDRIITLSTCSYEFNNARYAVFGKLTAGVPDDDVH